MCFTCKTRGPRKTDATGGPSETPWMNLVFALPHRSSLAAPTIAEYRPIPSCNRFTSSLLVSFMWRPRHRIRVRWSVISASVADEDVQLAITIGRQAAERGHIVTLRHVGLLPSCFTSRRPDFVPDSFQLVDSSRAQNNLCAAVRQQARRRAADTAACAGYHDHFAVYACPGRRQSLPSQRGRSAFGLMAAITKSMKARTFAAGR
jgi:hypothetical protein